MKGLVDSIQWYRARGSKDPKVLFRGNVPIPKVDDNVIALLQTMDAEGTLEGEIKIFHKAGEREHTWMVYSMKNGFALWRNNVSPLGESAPSAA